MLIGIRRLGDFDPSVFYFNTIYFIQTTTTLGYSEVIMCSNLSILRNNSDKLP